MVKVKTPPEFDFVVSGRLHMICVRNGKEVEKVDADSAAFLTNPNVVKSTTMDAVSFLPNVIFKVTLDFKEPLPCIEGSSAREQTNWVLCSGAGMWASYNRTDEKLLLQQCTVTTFSNVSELQNPFHLLLKLKEDEWLVEKMWKN